MILSMTGYGKSKASYNDTHYNIEIKSLNGKTSDVRCRIPNDFKSKEIAIRQLVLDHAHRGKFDLLLESVDGEADFTINKKAFKQYYHDLTSLKSELNIDYQTDIVQSILRIPNVVWSKSTSVTDEEWDIINNAITEALDNLEAFRVQEGVVMYEDLQKRTNIIQSLLNDITPHEQSRIEALKNRFQRNLEDFMKSDQFDRNRYEQEIIYYLEKLDINEERVRLNQHCNYFLEVLQSDHVEVGKKLGFIAQEMGREINTLGAKAQDKNIQKIVVNMKDQLEKIKEQLANIV